MIYLFIESKSSLISKSPFIVSTFSMYLFWTLDYSPKDTFSFTDNIITSVSVWVVEAILNKDSCF